MRVLRILFVIFLTGCAVNNNVWYKQNASQENFAQDRYVCLQESQQLNSTAFFGDHSGLVHSKQFSASVGMVTNNPLFTACMNAKGWAWINRNSMPVSNGSPIQQQVSIQTSKNNAEAVNKQLTSLCSAPEYALYYAKSPCTTNVVSMAMMSDKSLITEAEKEALDALSQARDKLFLEWSDIASKTGNVKDQQIVAYRNNILLPAAQQNSLELYDGKITWGQYNRRRKEINDAYTAETKRIRQK